MASPSSSATHRRISSSDERTSIDRNKSLTVSNAVVMTSIARHRKEHGKKMVNQYEFQQRLGRGQHGEVFIARDTVSDVTVAIKAVKRKNPKADRMSQLRKRNLPSSPHLPLVDKMGTTEQKIKKEIAIMKKCSHPHVVKLLEVIDDELYEKIYMVMEYLGGGEIKWRTEQDDPILRVSQTRRICRDVILGLEYLHQNGIIHRDIKPANLLWSDDRRMVKIADFGVSHYSYAQRLAAGQNTHSKEDDILKNEADLYKFAGTPMFLAPEILYDSTAETSNSSSAASNLHALGTSTLGGAGATSSRKKPGITKAIDIWALGVTLYALLFGRMPFSGDNEWAIYSKIKEEDWDVGETMGQDRLPVGGRHQPKPKRGEETEGYLVVHLLQGFLEKDPSKRITLDGVKRHPWILRDMPDAHQWLRQTSIDKGSLAVTDDETSSAVSSVKFRWPRIAKGLATFFIRNVRPQRSFRQQPVSAATRDEDRIGTRSMPHYDNLTRQRSIAIGMLEREKTKPHHRAHPRNKSSVDIRSQAQANASRSASGGQASRSAAQLCSQSRSQQPHGTAADGSTLFPRRESAPNQPALDMLQIPSSRYTAASSRVSSPQPTPSLSDSVYATAVPAISPIGVASPDTPDTSSSQQERPRSRLSVLTKLLRYGSLSWLAPSSEASTSTLPSGSASPLSPTTPPNIDGPRRSIHVQQPPRDLSARRSEDAFQHSRGGNPAFSLAMRAASWGEVGEYSRPSDDRTSIYSGERPDEVLDAETFLMGAGGVAQSPLSSVPSGVLSTVSSMVSIGPPVLSAAQALLQRIEASESPAVPDPAMQDPSILQRQGQYRSHATSPLTQSLYNGSQEEVNRSSSTFEQDRNSDSSGSRTPSDGDLHPSTVQLYQEEDEESDSDDNMHLEIRTRRPSWSANDPLNSPPRRSDIS